MWNPYSEDDMTVAFVIYTVVMNLLTSIVPLIFLELVEISLDVLLCCI
jgi:hypothetical protein